MTHIGRYRIRGLLGKGGMSRVYAASLPAIDRIVALKRLDPHPHLVDLLGMETLRSLFLAEAGTLAGLRHPNIVDIWDLDEAEGTPFYVMEYHAGNLGSLIGETYRSDMPTRVIRLDRSLHYARQILEGLRRLHSAEIVHRDMKPFNILITENDTIKLSDFGLSKVRGETFRAPSNLNVGSPFYAAPDQERQPDTVDASADVFAVGVILYRMLTGSLPMPDPPGVSDTIPEPSRLNPDLYTNWDAFLMRALDRNPAGRHPHAGSMLADLNRLAADWEIRRERSCLLDPIDPPPRAPKPVPLPRILQQRKIPARDAARTFGLDTLGRPRSYGLGGFISKSPGCVEDSSTGLICQQGGSEYPMPWPAAAGYISNLNRGRWGGFENWRLPVVEELMTLLTPVPHGTDFCIRPRFDPHCRWLWSADRCTFTSAWYISFDLGFVSRQDLHAPLFVKAVRSGS